MLAICDHCGHQNDVPERAADAEVVCQRCSQLFFAATAEQAPDDRRVKALLFGAVLVVLALIVALLLTKSQSGAIKSAQRAVFGNAIAGKLAGGSGDWERPGTGGNGTGASGNESARGAEQGEGAANGSQSDNSDPQTAGRGGRSSNARSSGPPDPLATNSARWADRSIGRLPELIGERKSGDDIRAGAAGVDEPAERVGNSRSGQITNAPSAGANPGNSDRRNSVETPQGADLLTGNSAGAEPLGSTGAETNSRPNALLLDDFSERLRQAGARSGDVQVSLEWKNVNDLDLHVIDPSGERIFYNNRESNSGGLLDVDMNASQLTARPVENIYWPEHGAPRGTYKVEVVHFANHGGRDPTEFNLRVINKGQTSYYRGYASYLNSAARNHVPVCTFVVR